MLCTIWKDIVLVRIVLKTRIGRDAAVLVRIVLKPRIGRDAAVLVCIVLKTRIGRDAAVLVQYGFSIQYRLVQYLSILYIALYNNLLV